MKISLLVAVGELKHIVLSLIVASHDNWKTGSLHSHLVPNLVASHIQNVFHLKRYKMYVFSAIARLCGYMAVTGGAS